MPLASGLAGQFGYGPELTPGTPVVPSLYLPIISESIEVEEPPTESEAIIAGRRVLDSSQWNGGLVSIGGDIALELTTRGLGPLFKAMFGAVAVSGTAPSISKVFTPGDLSDDSLTIQVGTPDVSGIVRPWTFAGCKVTSWEIAVAAGEIATLGVTVAGMAWTTATALATPVMPAGIRPFKWHHATVSIDGSPARVNAATLSGDNGLNSERYSLSSKNTAPPLEADLRTYEGSLEMEFADLTQWQRFADRVEVPLTLGFSDGNGSTLTIATRVRYDGERPKLSGRELLTQNVPIKCVGSTDAQAITVTMVNPEAMAA